MTDTYLVVLNVPEQGTYVQAVCSSRMEAHRELKRLGGNSSYYSIVHYSPQDFADE